MGDFGWPNGAQCAVTITIDFDGESRDLTERPTIANIHLAAEKPGSNLWGRFSYGRYGVRVGSVRLLQLLKQQGIRATWFVGGWDAEHYPDRIRQISDDGHEVAGHGYVHEDFSALEAAKARELIEKTHEILTKVTGRPPVGWRPPKGTLSWDTLRILRDMGYSYDSCFLDDDMPYRHVIDGQVTDLIEIPQPIILDDDPHYALYHLPEQVYRTWRDEFDATYAGGFHFSLKLHPRGSNGSGRAVRVKVVDDLLTYIKRHPKVWFGTCAEVADWARQQLS